MLNFENREFSPRYPVINCALFVVHEPGLPRIVDRVPQMPQYRGTAAALILPDGSYWIGVTICSPDENFVKKVGRAKAIGRAYQAARKDHLSPFRMPTDNPDYAATMTMTLRSAIDEFKKAKGVYPFGGMEE